MCKSFVRCSACDTVSFNLSVISQGRYGNYVPPCEIFNQFTPFFLKILISVHVQTKGFWSAPPPAAGGIALFSPGSKTKKLALIKPVFVGPGPVYPIVTENVMDHV